MSSRMVLAAAGTTPNRAVLGSSVLAVVLVTFAWRFLGFAGFNNDHYVHVARGYQMLLGEWPVRDFVDPGMPLMYAVSALGRKVLGPALGVEWLIVALAFAIAAACTVVAAARLSRSVAIGLLVALFEVLLNPRSFGYPKIVLYAVAALVFMRVAASPSPRRLAGLALMTAVAFLFRHDHGLFIGVGALATVLVASAGAPWPIIIRRAATFGGCVAALLAPWALFVQMNGGLRSYFVSAMEFSRGEAAAAGFRGFPAVAWLPFGTQTDAVTWSFYVFTLLPLVCLALLAWRHWRRVPDRWPGEIATVAGVALMAIPMNATFLRGGFQLDARIPDAFVPAGLLGAWLLAAPWTGDRRPWWSTAVSAAAIILAATAVVKAADVRDQLDRMNVFNGWRAMTARAEDIWLRLHKRMPERDHLPSRYSAALVPFIEYVDRCTSHDDRLLVTALFPEVYVMADRGFAGGHQAFMRGFYTSAADQAQMMSRLEHQSVPFVIMFNEYDAVLRADMPKLAAFVDTRYHLLASVDVPETKGAEIYVENARASARLDPATGWPCFVR
jgi:hypothetical protein